MGVPVGLPERQKLVVADKDLNGKSGLGKSCGVLFSLLEGSDQPSARPS